MIDVALCLLALAVGGMGSELYAAARAPLGYQDQDGFHLGSEAQEGAASCQGKNPG
jgi:hypothetical protein